MTVRRMRGASLGVAGALAAGLVIAPVGGATAAGTDELTEPVFQAVSAHEVVPVAGDTLLRARSSASLRTVEAVAARAATANNTQILQTWQGIQGAGQQGVSIAAGGRQVVQTVSDGSQGVIRAFVKATGALPKGGNETLLQFFNLSNLVSVSQASVVYDPVGKRFIAVAVADKSGDVGLVMRISKGTAATPLTKERWLKPVEFAFSTSDQEEPGRLDVDESKPLVGVTSDKIVITTEATDLSDVSAANRIFLFPKKEYFSGDPIDAWASTVSATYDGQAPAVNATKQATAFVAIPSDDVMPSPDTRGEITVTTYTGAANTNTAPKFSQTLLFPKNPLVAPPTIPQASGDTLDLGGLAFSGAVWRSNTLYAATTVAFGGSAAVRVFGVRTNTGVSLTMDKTLKSTGVDWFSPDLAVDGAGNLLLTANDVGSATGPSLAVFARKGSKWLDPLFVAKGNAVTDTGDSDWWNSTGAAWDPTSPWDVWIAGVVGNSGVPGSGLSSSVARVSVAKNKATIKASTTTVRKGGRVTFTVKLARPDSKNTIRGLPVALQRAPRSGGSFATIRSGTTAANGTAQWRVKVKKATRYRTLGKAVSQQSGEGRVVAKVTSRPVTITLR